MPFGPAPKLPGLRPNVLLPAPPDVPVSPTEYLAAGIVAVAIVATVILAAWLVFRQRRAIAGAVLDLCALALAYARKGQDAVRAIGREIVTRADRHS